MTKVPVKVLSRKDGTVYIDTVDAGEQCLSIVDDALEHLGGFVNKIDRDVDANVSNGIVPENVYLNK